MIGVCSIPRNENGCVPGREERGNRHVTPDGIQAIQRKQTLKTFHGVILYVARWFFFQSFKRSNFLLSCEVFLSFSHMRDMDLDILGTVK